MVPLTQRLVWKVAVAIVVGSLIGGGLPAAGADSRSPISTAADGGSRDAEAPLPEIHLYFADAQQGVLKAENRILSESAYPAETGRRIIEQLIRGPQSRLTKTIPPHARLKSFYLAFDGTAYVNWDAEIRNGHPGGALMEMLTVFSIVDSLVLNVPEIHRVELLIDGSEIDTLAGHIDVRQPIKANMLIIR